MAAQFELAILTPERSVFEGRVEYVEVPGLAGSFGVLAHHAALVTPLGPGVLLVRQAGGDEVSWRVSGGFFEVADDRATVLADEVSAGPA
jgi:F-type H+-transporting ATPase subunit epsilon